MSDLDRFWESVDRSGGDAACWLWTGRRYRDGYGEFVWSADGKERRGVAHRWLWQALNGPISRTLEVCHRCDVPACVRPDHLFVGTRADNERDKIAKGRRPSTAGESDPNARLSEGDVKRIREMRAGGASYVRIAGEYGLNYTHVRDICHGKCWANVPLEAPPPLGRLARKICPKCGGPCDPGGKCKPCAAAWYREYYRRKKAQGNG